jgi:hypothetical protein
MIREKSTWMSDQEVYGESLALVAVKRTQMLEPMFVIMTVRANSIKRM